MTHGQPQTKAATARFLLRPPTPPRLLITAGGAWASWASLSARRQFSLVCTVRRGLGKTQPLPIAGDTTRAGVAVARGGSGAACTQPRELRNTWTEPLVAPGSAWDQGLRSSLPKKSTPLSCLHCPCVAVIPQLARASLGTTWSSAPSTLAATSSWPLGPELPEFLSGHVCERHTGPL